MDFGDFAGFEATGADAYLLDFAFDPGAHGAQIRIKAAIGQVVGVRDVVPKLGTFAANITCSRQFRILR